ncbi:MFS transporter [Variovorax sp. YR752]|uniref:MFS transporter n=1 Tax=Variovorax sp. YR752 TaxID=1884383 RepID=UPI003137BDFB
MTTLEPADLPALAAGTFEQPTARRLSQARRASRAHFAALGVLGGAWGVHIPSVKAQYGLGEGSLSLVLFAAACGAVLSLFFAGRTIGRFGVRRALVLGAIVMAASLAAVLHWPSLPWLLPSMLLFGAAMSLYDVALNAEGTALESVGGRAIMGNLHGMFSVGGMAGAALTALLLRLDIAPTVQLAAISAAVVAVVLFAARFMLDAHPQDDNAGAQAHFAWPRGQLLIIGLLIFAGMTAEGVMYDWSVLYLKQELGMAQAQAGIGFAVFSAAMALARFGGDSLRARLPEAALLRGGALVAGVAMAALLLIGHPWMALVGYAFVGVGLALVVPILFNAATRVPGVSRAAAIASVSSIGYSGFLVGPPLIGSVAQAVSLTAALSLVVVAMAALALGARRIA